MEEAAQREEQACSMTAAAVGQKQPSDSPSIASFPRLETPAREGEIESAAYYMEETNRRLGTDQVPKENQESTIEYLRALANIAFYGKNYKLAAKILKKILSQAQDKDEANSILMKIECDIHNGRNIETVWESILRYDETFQDATQDFSILQLLFWTCGLNYQRPFGAILVNLGVTNRILNVNGEAVDQLPRIRFAYWVFAGMTSQVLKVSKRNLRSNTIALRVLAQVTRTMELSPFDSQEDAEIMERAETIASCYYTLAYCCNRVGMYKNAENCANEGLRVLFGTGIIAQWLKIKPHLHVSKGLSHVFRKQFSQAYISFETAVQLYPQCHGFNRESANADMQTLREMTKVLKQLSSR